MTKIWYFIKIQVRIRLKVYGTNGLNGSLKVFISNEKSKNKK